MTNYTVRVELHGVKHDSSKYTELHNEMRNDGFTRTVTIDGVNYKLPTAEYSMVSDDTKSNILTRAKTAAEVVMGSDKRFSILVTGDSKPRAQYNLEVG